MSSIIVVGLILAAFAALLHAPPPSPPRRSGWRRAADALFLDFEEYGADHPELSGKLGRSQVTVRTVSYAETNALDKTCITVRPADAIPERLILLDRRQAKEPVPWLSDLVQTGDETFDRLFQLRGDALVSFAVLGASCRSLLEGLAATGGVEVKDGELRFTAPRFLESAIALEALVRLAVQAAEALPLQRIEIPGRLLWNVQRDSRTGIRRRSLELLLSRYPDRDEARAALECGLRDAKAEVRVVAARHGGEAGFEPLRSIVEDPEADGAARVEALRSLTKAFPAKRSGPVLERCLKSGVEDEVLYAALEGLGSLGYQPAAERLDVVLERTASPETNRRVAQALGQIGGPVAEEALLRRLERFDDTGHRIPVVEALGQIGTARAVEPLLRHSRGLLTDGRLKEAARDAVRSIQARLGPVDAGRLSLAESPEGAGGLSLPQDQGGLSLAPPSEGP